MFDLFSPTRADLQELNLHHTISICAIAELLRQKGICTVEEFEAMRLKVTPQVEQAMQEKIDEARKQAQEDHPGLAMFGKFFGGVE